MNLAGASDLTRRGQDFVESVLQLKPRVAAFDCDGTLWSGDAGETFFDWEIRTGFVPAGLGRAMRARYADYKAGKVGEKDMCGELVTMHKGMADAAVMEAATEFMTGIFPGRVFHEIRELVRQLQNPGCEVWAVSSSNEWVIRAAMRSFGMGEDRILATRAELESGHVTDRLVRVPSGPDKVHALRQAVKQNLDAAFGNSRWDTEMLAMAKHPFAINPNADFEETARARGWTIYFPEGVRTAAPVRQSPVPR